MSAPRYRVHRARVKGASAALLGILWVVLTACDARFEFDVAGRAGAAGQSSTGAGAPSGGASAAGQPSTGAGAPSGGDSASAGSSGAMCGSAPACPSGLHCLDGHCYTCLLDADCVSPLPRCDTQQHRCVACHESSDCPGGFTCDPIANHCLPTCNEESDCPANSHGCDEHRAACYLCDEDRECANSTLGPLCAVDGSACVQCHDDADCPGKHCEQLAGRCVDCRDWRDCTSGLCDSSGSCLSG
ncbi:MAG: hypothetical protein ABIQ16_21195 [Polyangiaceae bacterium]